MEHILEYNDFKSLNENLERLAKKVLPGKNRWGEWDNFIYDMRHTIGVDKITLAQLVKHPNFDKLDSELQDAILMAKGTGKSPNAKFVKDFIKALNQGVGGDNFRDDLDRLDQNIFLAVTLKDQLKRKKISYEALEYAQRRILTNEYGYSYKLELNPKETELLLRAIQKPYTRFINQWLTERNIIDLAQGQIKRLNDRNSNANRIASTNWGQKEFAKLVKYITKKIEDSNEPNWNSFKVLKLDYDSSSNSKVVSSSFTTTYYYTAEVSLDGKKFKIPRFILSSDYVSGGWS